MGMSAGPAPDADDGDAPPVSDINTTPLVDVMLVLLIIFLITIPAVIQTAPVNLPKANNIALLTKPENITVGIDKDGNYYWYAAKLAGGKQELLDRIIAKVKDAVASGKPLPEVHVRADKEVTYQYVGGAIITVQRAGVPKVGFITEPDKGSRF
jgi:biopolymer transport protein ExbD